jgi:hypothetical protein
MNFYSYALHDPINLFDFNELITENFVEDYTSALGQADVGAVFLSAPPPKPMGNIWQSMGRANCNAIRI